MPIIQQNTPPDRRSVVCEAAIRQQILTLAAQGHPQEICGLLFGRRNRLTHAAPLPNIAPQPNTTYLLDGAAVTAALRHYYRLGLEWLAVYHSHPHGPATLSPADRAVAVAFPGVWQLLIVPPDHCYLFDVTPTSVERLSIITAP